MIRLVLLTSLLSLPTLATLPAGALAQTPAADPVPAIARGEDTRAHPELAGLHAQALQIRTVAATAAAPVAVGVWPAEPYQGALLVVDVATASPITGVTGTFLGKKLGWHRLDERTWRGMGPVPDDAKIGKANLQLEVRGAAGKIARKVALDVRPLDFDEDELRVDSKFTQLPKAALAQVRDDRAAMSAMWKKGSSPAPHFARNFVIPREDRTTAPYGTRRTYNGKTKSVHHGWDIDGNVGEEIRAPNAGVVSMAREQYYSGGTLFVDHGGGLYTGYFHMDSFAVKAGERVEAGQLLGTVGKSGRVTGPHLHWAAKIGGHYIHPASLLLFDFTKPMVEAPEGSDSARPEMVPARAKR